jgi:GT2 family glycosyltransferase
MAARSLPRLSICIPTVGRLAYLKEAVASARAQTLADIEILIGDNSDSPEIETWAASQMAGDERLRYAKTPRRLGMSENWNFIVGHARAEYVCLLGDDDRLLPTFAERLMREVTDGVAVVFSNHYLIDEDGRRLDDESRALTARYARAELRSGVLEQPGRSVWRGAVAISASITRTEVMRRLGFKTDINTPELELFVRVVNEGGRFTFVDEYLAEYRVHLQSATSRGLTIDRLAEHLERVVVSDDLEPIKRSCLAAMLVAGVGIRLASGDVAGARVLARSRYYPRGSADRRVVAHRIVLMLPDRFAGITYGSLHRIRGTIRDLKRLLLAGHDENGRRVGSPVPAQQTEPHAEERDRP